MSHVYMDNGTAVAVLRFDIGVTLFDEQTGTMLFEGDVPEHLAQHMGTDECAEWATQWVDAAYGLSVVLEDSEEVQTFGMLGQSYTEHYRAGARYTIGVCVIGKGKGYTVTTTDKGTETYVYLSESDAATAARYSGPTAVLGTTEVTL